MTLTVEGQNFTILPKQMMVIESGQFHSSYAQPISLQEAADVIGVGREHFCRFFKKNMELSFQSYVTVIRLGHAYRDLQTTDLPISVIMEQNGFTNQKLFNKSFKEFYGVTPRQIRSRHYNIFIR